MGPKPSQPQSGELFRPRLDEQLNMKHPLVRLAALIDWAEIERSFAVSLTSGRGRPALPPRLVAGLLYLQHTFDASDEAVVNTWVENPYWQLFCGETYLQTGLPIDPSSLTRWRKRIGEEGVETLLAASIDAARDVTVAASTGAQAQEPFRSEMRAFAFGYCPENWTMAAGQTMAVASNQALFSLMGVTYGGNGSANFQLPDLRGRTPLGLGTSSLGQTYAWGQRAGQEAVTLTTAQVPAHQHGQIATTAPATHATPAANALLAQAQNAGLYVDSAAADTQLTTATAGSGQPIATRDPYLAITWCVAMNGVFPSSN